MSITRRKLITTGSPRPQELAVLAVADRVAKRYGLIPPDGGGIYGPGRNAHLCLPAASDRKLAGARISSQHDFEDPFCECRRRLRTRPSTAAGRWIRGLAAFSMAWSRAPHRFSLADLKRFPVRSQITEVACEEGWSYIAEWIGTPLIEVLQASGLLPQARYLVYFSIEPDWWESIDLADALHPQTLLLLGDERWRPAGVLRRTAPAACASPARVQERQIHHPSHCHRLAERLRQGTRLGIARRWLCLVRRHLIQRFSANKRSRWYPLREHSRWPPAAGVHGWAWRRIRPYRWRENARGRPS